VVCRGAQEAFAEGQKLTETFMKIGKITGLAFLSLLVVGLFPETRQTLKWHSASSGDKAEDYAEYLAAWPNGRHAAEAQMRIEDLTWQQSRKTIKALRAYLHENPRGRFAAQVPVRESDLRADETPYLASIREGTEIAIKEFLIEYPGHAKEEDAKRILNDLSVGRDIVDLLNEKSIEVHTRGSGIQSVGIRVRKLVSYPVTIRVPVGSYFVSANSSSQNMVTTAEARITLTTDSWRVVSPPAACANMGKEIPSNQEILTLRRSSPQKDLDTLMPFLERAGVDSNTCQAAVWIVTDNAGYKDLGSLVVVPPGQLAILGARSIGPTEVARAMQICEDAGIHLERKRIWGDRQQILKYLGEGALKRWLEEKH
jgi:hypothetical protein